ncbi:MAG: SDR family oxidoreductase [Mycobacterium sp.]|nr:SDR family oxidoreductase [Mycobacterium sp.]
MSAVLMTGFPGFLGSALLPRILAKREGVTAVCVVQAAHLDEARAKLAEIQAAHPHTVDRVQLVEGDIATGGLGLSESVPVDDVTEVWHLAAVYDLSVPEDTAKRVNVAGTEHVLQFCRECSNFRRLQYVSTCYVSGRYDGEFTEEMLEEGQEFQNHYEETKYEAERLVRAAMAEGLPATIYRPGIVVGDSHTGETQKYDGPYFVAAYMKRLPVVAFLPDVDETVMASLVPRDYVIAAMDELSVMDRSEGKTYQLTDPDPPTAREVAEIFGKHLGKRLVWLPIPVSVVRGLLDTVPGMELLTGLPAETLDYFAFPTTYSTAHAVADLEGTGVSCPRFRDYADTLLDYMEAHPEFDSQAMV